jgi:hypothetical protein
MRLIGFAVILAFGLTLAPLAAEAQPVRSVPAGAKVDIIQSGRYLFEKRHTYALRSSRPSTPSTCSPRIGRA